MGADMAKQATVKADGKRRWIGRFVMPDGGEATLRCVTGGLSPGPDDRAEAIDDPFVAARRDHADPVALARTSDAIGGRSFALQSLLGTHTMAIPVVPTKIVGVGRNYRAHAEELGNTVPDSPLLFFKPPSCLLASGQPVVLPRGFDRIDMEAELVVVMGTRAKKVSAGSAWSHVAGLTLGNDVSCRDLQRHDKQWTRAKGFDGFGPLGPWIRMQEPGECMPVGLRIEGYLGDTRVQQGGTEAMVFSVERLIEHISACMSLEAGDLIYTGTPAGVSALVPGAITRVQAVGVDLGRLTNPVV